MPRQFLTDVDLRAGGAIPLGSAAVPGLWFSGDTNTGFYSPGADQFGISTGGTGRVTIDATTAPLKELSGSTFYPVATSVDIGSAPNQLSLNFMLGRLAFMSELHNLRPASTAPAANLDINFEYVSDTSIKVRMRGADGTVRSATLTLS